MQGDIEVADEAVERLDVVVFGSLWCDGPYTRGAPEGKFSLAISFTLADGTDVADRIRPQGPRAWLQGYLL